MFRNYSCVLLSDCTGEPIGVGLLKCNDDTLLRIQYLGWVSDSDEFIKAIKSHSA
jgi:ureidoacrylate peracid hydrolase